MKKRLLLLAGILVLGATTFAAEENTTTDNKTIGKENVTTETQNTVDKTGAIASGDVSIKDDTSKELQEKVDSDYVLDFLAADSTVNGTWKQVATAHKEIDDSSSTDRRAEYKNIVALNITDNLSLSLTSLQTINTPHQDADSTDMFSTELNYNNGTIFGTEITSSQLVSYERNDDEDWAEEYTLRQRFGFLSYLGDNGDTGRFDLKYTQDRDSKYNKDDKVTKKPIGKSHNDQDVELDLVTAWKFGTEQGTGALTPKLEALRTFHVDDRSNGSSEDDGRFIASLEYKKELGKKETTLGMFTFKPTVSQTVYTDGGNGSGDLDASADGINGSYGDFALELDYDNYLFISTNEHTKLLFHTEATSTLFSWTGDGHSSVGDNSLDKTDDDDQFKFGEFVVATKTYLNLSQDLTKSLQAELETGLETESKSNGNKDRKNLNNDMNAYVQATLQYTF
jgi:hypothetical protein